MIRITKNYKRVREYGRRKGFDKEASRRHFHLEEGDIEAILTSGERQGRQTAMSPGHRLDISCFSGV